MNGKTNRIDTCDRNPFSESRVTAGRSAASSAPEPAIKESVPVSRRRTYRLTANTVKKKMTVAG